MAQWIKDNDIVDVDQPEAVFRLGRNSSQARGWNKVPADRVLVADINLGGFSMKKALVGMAFFLIPNLAVPVWADEFYIVRDLATQKCTVVDKRPMTDTATITLADDTIYKAAPRPRPV